MSQSYGLPKARRPASARVVPAIPLSLSKPRAAPRPQPKPEPVEITRAASTGPSEQLIPPDEEVGQEKTTEHVEETPDYANGSVPSPDVPAPGTQTNGYTHVPTPAPSELTETVTPTIPNSQQPTRKPTDRGSMRQIRTELPPAFIPSAEQHTPMSATSSQARAPPVGLPHTYPHHPSVSSIVFGGQEPSSPSPMLPPGAGSAFVAPPYTAPPPYYGHAHRNSEPPARRGYPPDYPPTPSHPFQQSPAHVPFRYPPCEPFTPGGNGASPRANSRSPATALDDQRPGAVLQPPTSEGFMTHDYTTRSGPRSALPAHPRDRQIQYQHQVSHPPPPFPPDYATSLENAESLRDHVLNQYANPELADCHLQITEDEGDGRQYLECYKIILSRSSTLLKVIRASEPPTSAALKLQVHIRLPGQHVCVNSFLEAVRYLHGGPLPSLDIYNRGPFSGVHGSSSQERMDLALQQTATAAWLKIAPLGHRGVDIASGLLHWDNVVLALTFATDGGLGQMWMIDDGSEERTSTCSSDDSWSKPEAGGTPTYDPYATNLLHRVLDFAVHALPPNFYLDAAAPQLTSCPRLPPFQLSHESKPSQSDPRLSKIRFGTLPSDDHQRPSPATTTISSILLSLPFPLLKFVLEHPDLAHRLGPDTVGSIIRQVASEREARRQKALKARTASRAENGIDTAIVQNLYWEELVEPSQQHRAGFRLARKRRGIDTPPSSGADSEQNK